MARTLADMTPEEQQACVGRWADIGSESAPMVIRYVGEVLAAAWVDPRHPNRGGRATMRSVTPRLDLMRAWNPDGTPVAMAEETAKRVDDTNPDVYALKMHRRFVSEWEATDE